MSLLSLIPALLGVGSAVFSSDQQKKATNAGLDAQNYATDKQLALQQRALDTNVGLNAPFIAGGQGAYDKLLTQYGIKPAGGNAGVSPQPDRSAAVQSYLDANPDLAAEIPRVTGPGTGFATPEEYLRYHDTEYDEEGRPSPYSQPPQGQAPPDPGQQPQVPTDLMTAQRPEAMGAPSYGPAPSQGFSAADFEASPAYAWMRDQALRGVNASYGARGILKSGSAVDAILNKAKNLAGTEYYNWGNLQLQRQAADRAQHNTDRSYGTNVWNTQQNRADNIFNTDRGYQTGRFDNTTGNLFDLSQIGLEAAGNVAGAQSNYAANAGNIYGSQANNTANAAASRAGANAGVAGTIAGAGYDFLKTNPFAPAPPYAGPTYGAPTQVSYNPFSF